MRWLSIAFKTITGLFAPTTNSSGQSGPSVVDTVVKQYDNVHPGEVTKHGMYVEDAKQDEQNVNDARQMQFPQGGTNAFDTLVNGLNRLPRPMFSLWAFGVLVAATFGMISSTGFQNLDPFSQSLIKMILEFFFGVRVVSQDIPRAVALVKNLTRSK